MLWAELVAGGGEELELVIPGHEAAELVVAGGIRGGRALCVAETVQESNRYPSLARLTRVLDPIVVGVLPDEVADAGVAAAPARVLEKAGINIGTVLAGCQAEDIG